MGWVVGGLLDYNDSYLGQVIVIVIGRPRSLTILSRNLNQTKCSAVFLIFVISDQPPIDLNSNCQFIPSVRVQCRGMARGSPPSHSWENVPRLHQLQDWRKKSELSNTYKDIFCRIRISLKLYNKKL